MTYLERLNNAFERLKQARSADDLYRQAVLAAQQQLGFDRAGIFLYDRSKNQIVGTWGNDADGQLRDEHDYHAPLEKHLIVQASDPHIRLTEDAPLKELGQTVGTGWHLQAAIFSGEELHGWLFLDNLIHHQPITDEQFHVIQSFANALGQLIVHSRIEDTLIDALDSLVSNENRTLSALDRVTQLEAQIAGSRRLVQLAERLSGLVPMSARAVGNLVNFVSLLSSTKFADSDQALLASAQKSASQLSRIYRYFDQKVHEATENDVQTLQASVVQQYWQNQFSPLFRATPHELEIHTDTPEDNIALPLILLTQLVKELLSNALSHGLENSTAGRASVTLELSDRLLCVHVEDSGIGLEPDQYEEVLKLFVTSKPNEYLGTGLNVTQHYTERWLNGQLELSESPLGGLRCTLRIPRPGT